MPYLKIQTNQPIEHTDVVLSAASKLVATALGKPERYVVVTLEPSRPMLFGGSDDPLAFLELKSIGLAQDETDELSDALCGFVEEHLAVDPERVYIEFAAARGAMWGWNRGTF